nr:hypothetical protein [uncultured Cellulosilyticum sp.]
MIGKAKSIEIGERKSRRKTGRLVRASRQVRVDEETVKMFIEQSQSALKSKELTECKKVLNNYIEKVVVFEDIVARRTFQVSSKG